MNFKIDTTDTYAIIAPTSSQFDAKLAAALNEECHTLTENGSNSFIIDLSDCNTASAESADMLLQLHEQCYSQQQSIVFIGLKDDIIALLKQTEVHLTINIAPTKKEAIDIISMEILERDLMSEDDTEGDEDFF